MQWDAPVNIPIVPKDICEPKTKHKKAIESHMYSTAHGVGRSQPAASIYVRFTKQTTLSTFLLERTRKSPEPVSPLLSSSIPYPTMKRSFTMDCRCTLCARPATPIAVFLNMLDFFIGDRQHTHTPTHQTAPPHIHRTRTPHHTTPTDPSIPHAHTLHTPHKETHLTTLALQSPNFPIFCILEDA